MLKGFGETQAAYNQADEETGDMIKEPEKNDDMEDRINDLPVVVLPEFTDIQIKGDYSISLKKLGNAIVLIQPKGNLKNYNFKKEIVISDDFHAAVGIKRPYVVIADLSKTTGYFPFCAVRKLIRYHRENPDVGLESMVLIGKDTWIKTWVAQVVRFFNPSFRVVSAASLTQAVEVAKQSLDPMHTTPELSENTVNLLRFQDVLFKREWEYHSPKSSFAYKVGCIPHSLLYISIQGVLNELDDIKNAAVVARQVIDENGLRGIPYILTNFSELADVRSMRLRQQFIREVKKGIAESGNGNAFRVLINPGRFNKLVIRIFAPFVNAELVIVDTIEQAFDRINNNSSSEQRIVPAKDAHVRASDLEELSNAFGALLWSDNGPDYSINISPDNPLSHLAESLGLVKTDLSEFRENERKIQQERLGESEAARQALEKEQESRRILLDNIPTQIWYLTDEYTYGTVNKSHADFMGTEAGDLEYKNMFDIMPREVAEICRVSNQEVFSSGKVVCSQEWAADPCGESRLLSITKTPRLGADGKVEYVVCSAEDITDSWRSAEALRISEERMRLLSNNLPNGMVYQMVFDIKTGSRRFTYLSEGIEMLQGVTAVDAMNDPMVLYNQVHEEDLEPFLEQETRSLAEMKDLKAEIRITTPSGETKWIMIASSPRMHSDTEILEDGIVIDISDLKQSEEELKNERERLAHIIQGTNAATWEWNIQTGEVIFNERWAEIIGYRLDELAPVSVKTWGEFAHPEDLRRSGELLEKHFAGEQEYYIIESRMKHKAGHWVWVLDHGKVFAWTQEGKPLLMRGTHQDITRRKHAEHKISESEAKLKKFVANQPGIAFVLDKEGVFMLSEGQGLGKIGLQPGQVVGQSVFEVYKDLPEAKEFVRKALAGQEYAMTLKIGDVYFESWIGPLMDEKGKITGAIGISADITARIQSEEIRQQLEIAQKTTQFKQNFLAKMSHEIRTPLTGILGMIDILGQTILNRNQLEYLNTIQTSGESLKTIINQVLDYSKMEAGKIIINPVVFEFTTLPESAMHLYKDSMHKGVDFAIDSDFNIPPFIKADQSRLLQVLNNLVSNAVKFTHAGSVTIRSTRVSSGLPDKKIRIKMQVIDTGRGISADLQTKLFSPFVQEEESSEGTGLGLSICKELVALMGGEIGVVSKEEKGSMFWFTFTAQIACESHLGKKNLPQYDHQRKLHILVTEDSLVIQKYVNLLLKSLGHTVSIAENGQQALDVFEPGKFDLIMMDVQMPVMDGVTATLKLKEKYTNLPPIVGLSANAFEGDQEKYISLGMDDYLTKPFNREDLGKILSRVIPGVKS